MISYTASRRTQEIGIRVAVGATLRELHLMIFRQGFATAALGLVIGIVAAVQLLHLPGVRWSAWSRGIRRRCTSR